jgi:ABC-type iron transport system FetAB permease component
MSDIPIGIPGQTTQSDLTWLNVAIGLAFIIFDIGISTVFRLGAGVSLLVAALRCIGQLAAVATILQQVFDNKNPWTVALISGESIHPSSSTSHGNSSSPNSRPQFLGHI